jgi:hypothetical protein
LHTPHPSVNPLNPVNEVPTRLAAIYQQKLAALEALKKSLPITPSPENFGGLTDDLTHS